MIFISLGIAQKRNPTTNTYDAEVYLGFTDENGKILKGTKQRLVSKEHATRANAEAASLAWIEKNLFPVINKLPVAKL